MLRVFIYKLLFEIRDVRRLYLFRRPVLLVLLVYCCGILICKKAGLLDRVAANDPSQWAGERGAVTGVVAAQPDPRPTGCVYRLQVESVDLFDQKRVSSSGQILVHVMNSTSPVAHPGDRVRALGRLQKPKAALTPGAFDYQDYLATHGVHAVMYTSARSFENMGAAGSHRLMRWGWLIKQRTVHAYDRHLSGEQATVLAGLAVGNRPRFHPEIKQLFVESGTMHVLVASGSNVAFVIALWFVLARLFRTPRRWALASAVPAVWGYVLVAGADAPIARAGLMGTIGVIAYLSDREDRPYHALGLTALVILLWDPRALFDIGFQMSFGTVFGLIYYLTPAEAFIQRAPWPARWPLRLLAATLTAQIWIAPVTATTFQRFFPVGILSNLIVVPLSALGLTVGIALAAVDFLPLIAAPVVWAARIYLSTLIHLVRFFAERLGTSIWVAPPHPLTTGGFLICCLSVVSLNKSVLARIFFGVGLFGIAIGWMAGRSEKISPREMEITWIDNGKRLTTIVQTPDGSRLLINPGPKGPVDTTERALMPFLTRRGISSLDAVLITDRDQKRVGGVESLVKWVRVSTVATVEAPALWITDGRTTILIADKLTTKVQRALMRQETGPIDIVQSHFPRNWIWLPEFLEKFKPAVVIETYPVSAFRPSVPPWPDIPAVAPQNRGWYRWNKSIESLKLDD